MGNCRRNPAGRLAVIQGFSLIELIGRKQRFIIIMSTIIFLATGSMSVQALAQTTTEYRVKVAILLKLTNLPAIRQNL